MTEEGKKGVPAAEDLEAPAEVVQEEVKATGKDGLAIILAMFSIVLPILLVFGIVMAVIIILVSG